MIDADDAERINASRRLAILDGAAEPAFDAIARLAQSMFKTPAVFISLMSAERTWLKARIGLGLVEAEKLAALHQDASQSPPETTYVTDARLDQRWWNNPLVTGEPFIRFCAASPLIIEGAPVGVLCISDRKPHYDFGPGQALGLESTARVVEELLLLRLETDERQAEAQALRRAGRSQDLAEDLATQSEQRYRLLAENANDMIALTSVVDSAILYVSPGCRRVLGYDPEELVGRPTLGFTHPDDRQAVIALFSRLVAAGPTETTSPYRFRGLRKDGSWAWLEGQPRVHFDEAGAPTHFQDVVRDITARKVAEDAAHEAAQTSERLRAVAAESEERYRLLTDNATDMIARYGLDGAISFVSPACLSVMGFSPEELLGRRTIEFVHPDDLGSVRQQFADYVASGSTAAMRTRHRIRRKDGQIVWLEGHPLLVRTADGQPKEFYDVMRDVTDRVRLEQDLMEAKVAAEAAMQAKSDFLANMSHELRTPLTGILGYADVLAASPSLTPVSQRYAALIAQSGRNLLALVNDVLDLSKLEAGGVEFEPGPVELSQFLADTLDLVRPQASAKGLALELEASARSTVEVDESRLRQVILNLLSNAVKFTEAGTVRLRLDVGETKPGAEAKRDLRHVRICVIDSGIGIAAHQLGQVFGRFEQADASITRRFGGTGLGLSISRAIVHQLGGDLRADSEPGVGSTFTLTIDLPACDGAEADPPASSAAPAWRFDGLRVLLAEDVAINRELIHIFLAKEGVDLTSVENGAQAVEAATRQPYDLVLMDMQMPVLDGLEATRRIRASSGPSAQIPILALTANVLPEEIAKCRTAGMNGHIGKPFTAESLKSAIETALHP